MPARAPPSMDMLQTVMRPSMERRANGFAGVFDHVAGAAADADFADDGENDVFGGDAVAGACPARRSAWFWISICERHLRGQHVFHFAGADAESQRAERAVRGGVAIAADDGVAGLRDAQLGADDMNDALICAVHVEQVDAEFFAVLLERVELRAWRPDRATGRRGSLVETE